MARVADIRLKWKKSPSSDIVKTVLTLANSDVTVSEEIGSDVEEFMIVVKARGTFKFSVVSTDQEGKTVSSLEFVHTLGDLEDPFPATDLGFEIVAIRDVPDEVPV